MLKLHWGCSLQRWEPEDPRLVALCSSRLRGRAARVVRTPQHARAFSGLSHETTQGVSTKDPVGRHSCKNATKGTWNCICKVQFLCASPSSILLSWLPFFKAKLLSKNKVNLREKV